MQYGAEIKASRVEGMTIPIKITESYVVDVAKPILKFIRKAKARIAKTVLKKKKVRGLMQPDLRLTEQYC